MTVETISFALMGTSLVALLVWLNHLTKQVNIVIEAHNNLVDMIMEAAEEME